MKPVQLFDLAFENGTLIDATEKVITLARSDAQGQLVVTPNVDHIVTMQRDPVMRDIFQSAALRFPDGMPLVWLSRLNGGPQLVARITGADLLISISAAAARDGLSIFLLGGQPGVADLAGARLKRRSPRLKIAGTYSPPFGFEHDDDECRKITNMIRASGAKILFVGVGTPKQEKWIAKWGKDCNVPIALGVGAAFDFAAGTARRAPRIMQRSGFEWLWRLAFDPRRLFRRYIIRDSQFLFMAAQHLFDARYRRWIR